MSTNLEYGERERQRKREIRATGQRSSTRKGARARDKKTKGDFFCWRNNKKFCSGRMLAATRVKMSYKGKKTEQEHVRHFLIKRVTRKFHVLVVQNNAREMYNEKVCCTCKVTFLLIRPIVFLFFFTVLVPFATQHYTILYFV